MRISSLSSQYKKTLQSLGMKQTLSQNGHELEIMGEIRRKCSFCKGPHMVTSCGKLADHQSKGRMYKLSMNTPHVMSELKARMKQTMPVILDMSTKGVLCRVHNDFKSSNFVIHEASIVAGSRGESVEDLNYRITMLDKSANSHVAVSNQWINGTQMSILIAHQHKVVKYVFDETVKNQMGWLSRNEAMNIRQKELSLLSQLSESATFGASAEMGDISEDVI